MLGRKRLVFPFEYAICLMVKLSAAFQMTVKSDKEKRLPNFSHKLKMLSYFEKTFFNTKNKIEFFFTSLQIH